MQQNKPDLTVREQPGVQNAAAMEIDLAELFMRCLAGWKLIVLFALIGTVVMGALTNYHKIPLYRATSTIYIVGSSDTLINMSDLSLGSALASDYVRAFRMWEMHEQVAQQCGLGYTYDELMNMVSVYNPSDTRMLDISVTCDNPDHAALLANEYAKVSSQFISEIMSTEKPNIVSVALTPVNPINMSSRVKNCAIGFMGGFILAVGIIFLRMILDDNIKTADDIKKYTGLVNMALIPLQMSEKDMKAHPNSTRRKGKHKR